MCHSSHKNAQAIPVRPHHGMCLAFFIGKGYSEGFSAHMEKMLKEFQKNLPVRLVVHTDEICSACPNNEKNVCNSTEKVEAYDRKVLEICGISEGTELDFLEFVGIIQEKIINPGLRDRICGDCQWNEICSSCQSRWEVFSLKRRKLAEHLKYL